jgi:hypothetical protein
VSRQVLGYPNLLRIRATADSNPAQFSLLSLLAKGKCMNKKAIGLLLALGLAGILAACGGGGDTTAPEESPAAAPESPAASPPP